MDLDHKVLMGLPNHLDCCRRPVAGIHLGCVGGGAVGDAEDAEDAEDVADAVGVADAADAVEYNPYLGEAVLEHICFQRSSDVVGGEGVYFRLRYLRVVDLRMVAAAWDWKVGIDNDGLDFGRSKVRCK